MELKRIIWNREYKVDITEISYKQLKIIDIFEELSSIEELKKIEYLEFKILGLIENIRVLFQEEEKIMRNNEDKQYKIHKDLHIFFIDQLEDFQIKIRKENKYYLFNEIHFLKKWLLNHIITYDKNTFAKS